MTFKKVTFMFPSWTGQRVDNGQHFPGVQSTGFRVRQAWLEPQFYFFLSISPWTHPLADLFHTGHCGNKAGVWGSPRASLLARRKQKLTDPVAGLFWGSLLLLEPTSATSRSS